MKKMILLGSVTTLMLLSSCGGEDCYRCRKDSYFNGINYTDPGPWSLRYKKDGESDADFEARIKDEISNGYTCEPK